MANRIYINNPFTNHLPNTFPHPSSPQSYLLTPGALCPSSSNNRVTKRVKCYRNQPSPLSYTESTEQAQICKKKFKIPNWTLNVIKVHYRFKILCSTYRVTQYSVNLQYVVHYQQSMFVNYYLKLIHLNYVSNEYV